MELIDFDSKFSAYLYAWLNEHQDEYDDISLVETQMPQLYEHFINTPAEWLGGRKPGGYFDEVQDPWLLVKLLQSYIAQGITVPEILIARIAGMGRHARDALMNLLMDEAADRQARMYAIHLLHDSGSELPLSLYISWQMDREENYELADYALEELDEMGEEAVFPMLEALPQANDMGREALLSILSRYPQYPEVYDALIRLFDTYRDRQAILAAYLGRLGDERALPLLLERAKEENLKYLDYIELRAAIEALGGEAPAREFPADPEYDALRDLM